MLTNLGQSVRYGHVKETKLTDWIHANPVKTDESKLCSYSLALGCRRASRQQVGDLPSNHLPNLLMNKFAPLDDIHQRIHAVAVGEFRWS